MQLKFQSNYKWINYKFAQFSKEKCDVGVNLCPFILILKKMNFFFKCADTRNRDAILKMIRRERRKWEEIKRRSERRV